MLLISLCSVDQTEAWGREGLAQGHTARKWWDQFQSRQAGCGVHRLDCTPTLVQDPGSSLMLPLPGPHLPSSPNPWPVLVTDKQTQQLPSCLAPCFTPSSRPAWAQVLIPGTHPRPFSPSLVPHSFHSSALSGEDAASCMETSRTPSSVSFPSFLFTWTVFTLLLHKSKNALIYAPLLISSSELWVPEDLGVLLNLSLTHLVPSGVPCEWL